MEKFQHKYETGVEQLCAIFRDIGYDDAERTAVLDVSSPARVMAALRFLNSVRLNFPGNLLCVATLCHSNVINASCIARGYVWLPRMRVLEGEKNPKEKNH